MWNLDCIEAFVGSGQMAENKIDETILKLEQPVEWGEGQTTAADGILPLPLSGGRQCL